MSDERDPKIEPYKGPAGGWGSVKSVAKILKREKVPIPSTVKELWRQNKPRGFTCVSCAWPQPEHPLTFEFCENGAKASAWELTSLRVTPEFFAQHTVSELRDWSDHDLEQAGRLTHPMRYDHAGDVFVACVVVAHRMRQATRLFQVVVAPVTQFGNRVLREKLRRDAQRGQFPRAGLGAVLTKFEGEWMLRLRPRAGDAGETTRLVLPPQLLDRRRNRHLLALQYLRHRLHRTPAARRTLVRLDLRIAFVAHSAIMTQRVTRSKRGARLRLTRTPRIRNVTQGSVTTVLPSLSRGDGNHCAAVLSEVVEARR